MSSPPRPYDEFVEFLRDKDLQEKYEKEVKRTIRKTKTKFRGERDSFTRNLRDELANDDEHRRVLNACVYPFAQQQVAGYYFVRAAPLAELDPPVKNMDFLIVCASPSAGDVNMAIVGESKGSVNDPEPIVTETKERVEVFEKNWEHAKKNYLNNTEMLREFVLGVFAADANETAKSVIRKGGGIIVWSVDFSNDPILDLHRPDLDRSDRKIRETMYHKNRKLNEALNKLPTSQSFKTFYLQSHIVAKLRVLTGLDKGKADATFTFEDVKALVKEALDYIGEDSIINRETSTILTVAQSIGFLTQVNGGRFKIKSRNKQAAVRANELERLWLDSRVKREILERIDEQVAELQPSYEKERLARPTLAEVAP